VEFLVLGPLEVREGTRLISLGGAKQRALLALLVLHANEVVSRDRLIDGLWGEEPPASAGHTIETYVSRIRRALHYEGSATPLLTRAPGYVLHVDVERVDLHRFMRLVEEGRQELAAEDPWAAGRLIRDGLGLFRGPPLDDLAFFPFARTEIDRLNEMRLAALEERIQADLASGRHGELAAEIQVLAAAHPLRESFRGQLMLALYRGGRQADALEVYRETRRYLADELGVDPNSSLQRLEQAILRQDPALEVPPLDALGVGLVARALSLGRGDQGREPGALTPVIAVADPKESEGLPYATERTSGRAHIRSTSVRVWRPIAWARSYPLLAVLATVLVASVSVGIPTLLHDRDRSLGAVDGNAVGILDPRTGAIVGEVPVGASPGGMVAGEGSVWVTNFGDHTVSRIDPEEERILQTITVGSGPSDIASGNGTVWVTNTLDGTLSRIDPETNRAVQTTSVGDGPSAVTFGAGSVWVANSLDQTIARVDATTGEVTARIPLGASPTDLSWGEGALWVTSEPAGAVFRIDPDTADTAQINVGTGPTGVAVGGGAVWVANTLDGTVSRIDPSRNVVAATVPVGDGPTGIAVSPRAVWITNEVDGTLSRLDPERSELSTTARVGNRPHAIALAEDTLWVAVRASGAAHRGGTLGVVFTQPAFDSIDPAIAHLLSPSQLLGMTNDGLVTLNHVGGSDGVQLVPDLAVSLPTPTDGGRTYRFQLRPGIRYSTGERVQPEDFRRAIERDFRLHSPGAGFYTGIVGAVGCVRYPERCDLTEGIGTEDEANTVTFHLRAPDPEFLYKLTLTFAYAVPAGVPDRDVGLNPVPATGPYMIDSYVPGQALRLVRNPFFHEWSKAAQPDGYVDVIVFRLGVNPLDAVTAIERGEADWGVYDIPLSPPADRLQEILIRYPAQVHINPSPEVEYFIMNTRVPPFDDLRVRRALNLAVDRNVVVRLDGGPDLAQPTCQVLPPGLPGFRPYCPYTVNPDASGMYTGPDLTRARGLVEASGTKGMRIRVLTDPHVRDTRHVVSILRKLGYRASAWPVGLPEYNPLASNSANRVQISRGGTLTDYPAASDIINQWLSCSAWEPNSDTNNNRAQFCDRRIEATIRTALDLQLSDPQAASDLWTEIDRQIVNEAPWLPLVNLKTVDFVSDRVGNYQFHPQWGILLDQLWIVL